jgi:hypothetical protein
MSDDQRFELHRAFMDQEAELMAALRTGQRNAGHAGVQGAGTETHWHAALAGLPARYKVSRVFVVDSRGGQSQQIDLAIIDRHFSPLFWEWGGHCYVPAESVYAVFEIKPKINRDYILYAGEKIASVRQLHRTSVPFAWAMGMMKPRPEPPPILGGFLAGGSGWSPPFGETFRKALGDVVPGGEIDLGCVLNAGSFEVPFDRNVDDVVAGEADTALVTFMLTLLKRLQGIGSVPAIDYVAYARWIGDRAGSRKS